MTTPLAPWPPPPDLASIQQLVREADVEHLIEEDAAPLDEYDPEAQSIHAALAPFATAQLTASAILPILEATWQKSFSLSPADLAPRRPALDALATQIARFFGPEANPHTRNSSLASSAR